jgi:hypothetical protein
MVDDTQVSLFESDKLPDYAKFALWSLAAHCLQEVDGNRLKVTRIEAEVDDD